MREESRINPIVKVVSGYVEIENTPANIALLMLRIFSGFTIMGAGLDKLPNTDWMIDQVTSLGFPFPVFFAWLASFSEFAFGALLVIGLLTRLSGVMLAITIGVAAFGFHQVTPLISMHITQNYFWAFVLFIFLGPGRYSIDYLITKAPASSLMRLLKTGVPALTILLLIGLYIEFFTREEIVEEEITIESINVPGSFNDWDPSANEMSKLDENNYSLEIEFKEIGPVEFKFTTNRSWDTNWGDNDQKTKGFPVKGIADLNSQNNLTAYIPNPGIYLITLNSETYSYTLDSLKN